MLVYVDCCQRLYSENVAGKSQCCSLRQGRTLRNLIFPSSGLHYCIYRWSCHFTAKIEPGLSIGPNASSSLLLILASKPRLFWISISQADCWVFLTSVLFQRRECIIWKFYWHGSKHFGLPIREAVVNQAYGKLSFSP